MKNITIIVIAYGEVLLYNGNKVSNPILLSFGLIVLSSVFAGWNDLFGSSGDMGKASLKGNSKIHASSPLCVA